MFVSVIDIKSRKCRINFYTEFQFPKNTHLKVYTYMSITNNLVPEKYFSIMKII